MDPIKTLDEMVQHVKQSGLRQKVAVAMAEDSNTIGAIAEAIREGFIEAIMIGDQEKIKAVAQAEGISTDLFTIQNTVSDSEAAVLAVKLVREGTADVLMKGLVGTDKFLRAVMDKQTGLLPPKAVMTYVCALQIPRYHKLLFISDTAVLPFPDLDQKIAMVNYAVAMAKNFGISKPKVALLSAAEKWSSHFPSHTDYALISKMAQRNQIKDCIIDGPLDLFLACDKESVQIKNVPTPVDGDADIAIFPTLESSNTFYKGVMLFGGGELAGLIQGTTKPVVVMSRSESSKSKFYCIALSCLMAANTPA